MKSSIRFLKYIVMSVMALTLVNCSNKSSSNSSQQCGSGMIYYGGQCVYSNSMMNGNGMYGYNNGMYGYNNGTYGYNTGYGNTGYNTGGYGSNAMCAGNCGAGMTQMPQGSCLPQASCGACYGYYNGSCYIGAGANRYYGYY